MRVHRLRVRQNCIRTTPKRSAERRLFSEHTGTWNEAAELASGYEDGEILRRVLVASRAVQDGKAVHERDSVNFDRIQYSWPVLAALMWSVAISGELRVIDVGGSLGSSLRQNRRFIEGLPKVSWAVVEQAAFVEAGKENFASDVLSFHETIAGAAKTRPTVGLLSSSLQYLGNPTEVLESLTQTSIEKLIIDRTPVHDEGADIIAIQEVPAIIYPATYPAWLFSLPRLLETLGRLGWSIIEQFDTLERPMQTRQGRSFRWTGIICARTECGQYEN